MRVLLDTHIWIWLNSSPEKLSQQANKAIKKSKNNGLYLSIISCLEVSKLHEKGRIHLSTTLSEWINQAIEYPELSIIDINPKTCTKPAELNIAQIKDPIDQIIIATAMDNKLPLITADENIRKFAKIKTIW